MTSQTPLFVHDKPLRELCTLGIGGPAQMYATAHTLEEMSLILRHCHQNKLRTFILGKGSNCIFDDRGFSGAVIHNKIDFIEEKSQGYFHVGAGYSFSLLGVKTARKGWTGLEFASGIPGSVGGAVFMNAGASGAQTADSLIGVDFITEEGDLKHFDKSELQFSYRHSTFHSMKGAIVAAHFKLLPSEEARKKQIEIITYRTKTQPYGEMSAGCVFRNPQDFHAGALIDQCGLKGLSVGGAKVSGLHANFIINDKNGTSKDVIELVALVQTKVKENLGVELETEVRYIPYCELP